MAGELGKTAKHRERSIERKGEKKEGGREKEVVIEWWMERRALPF